MTDNIGLIKNPLTVIAIFAGIAEVSGTIVLPFIVKENQELFTYFLIAFPTLLVIAFFLTLNLNHKVLYAPSDYQNEENFFRFSSISVLSREEKRENLAKEMETEKSISHQILQEVKNVPSLIQNLDKMELKAETLTVPEKKIEDTITDKVNQALEIEETVLLKIKENLQVDYEILPDIAFTQSLHLDVFLQSYLKSKRDIGVEIKYLADSANFGTVKKSVDKLIELKRHFEFQIKKAIKIHLVVVLNEDKIAHDEISRLQVTISNYIRESGMSDIRPFVLNKDQLNHQTFRFVFD